MKKITIYLMILMVSLCGHSLLAKNPPVIPVTNTVNVSNTEGKSQADAWIARLYEIRDMDKSNMSYSEKKDLRKEVRLLNKQLIHGNGGIYLSLGAIIVVILLLILLL